MLGASPTAQFGGALGANALADETLQTKLEGLFDEIRENTFAEKLSQESRTKYAFTKRELQKLKEHPIESVGESVRKKIHPRSPS